MQVKLKPALLALALLQGSALALLPGAALAQERPWPVLERMGVVGTWSPSCGAGPSKDNPFVTYYTEKQGLVRRKVDVGGDVTANTTVDAAQQLSPTTLRMRQRLDDAKWGQQNGAVFEVVMEMVDGRTRVLSSIASDGKPAVKDGRIVATGVVTPRNEKCGN